MALFNVSGWSVPSEPTQAHGSKKRKRLHDSQIATDLDELVKLMKVEPGRQRDHDTGKERRKSRDDRKRQKAGSVGGKIAKKKQIRWVDQPSSSATRVKHVHERPASNSSSTKVLPPQQEGMLPTELTSLQKKMKQNLDGARFR